MADLSMSSPDVKDTPVASGIDPLHPSTLAHWGNFLRRTTTNQSEGIIDEENINWRGLLTRVFLVFLLVVMLACLGLYALSPAFAFLACMVCALLVLCLIGTFVDLSFLWRCLKANANEPAQPPDPELNDPQSPQNPESTVTPFADYHKRL
ncbi:hypothetical protein B484DRAFT_449359 [Ochromonadaceae sp. CCMP2298]|nr:hypothetical protein B484DRAFT_449359 [Ochromonadaceae sp. CCMP2298]